MTPEAAFFTVHKDLPREGPGLPEDVAWVLGALDLPAHARIFDAGAGPGADTRTFAALCPKAEIIGCDQVPQFVAAAQAQLASFGPRVQVLEQDYMAPPGAFDLIWSAGAVYFVGIEAALAAWRPHLRPGGAVAFSSPTLVKTPPSSEVSAFWEGEGVVSTAEAQVTLVEKSGWQVLAQRWIIGAAWEAYYTPMAARLDALEASGPGPELREAIAEARQEIAAWHAAPDEIAYLLFLVQPR